MSVRVALGVTGAIACYKACSLVRLMVREGWEVRELVRRALSALPERQREVLHLKEIEGYPTREIAAMLGCDEAQVRVILSRGRMALRGILQKMRNDERTTRTTRRPATAARFPRASPA